jgi:hypothetical protein
MTRDAGPDLPQLPIKAHIPPHKLQSTPSKDMLHFVEVQESSGRLNSAARSQVKSFLMRKTHDIRRSHQKSVKNRYRPLAAHCNPEHHKRAINDAYGHSTTLQPPHSNSQPNPKMTVSAPNKTPSNPSTDSRLEVTQASAHKFTIDVKCAQCGCVILQRPSIGREDNFITYHNDPRTLLDTSLGDPFDSSPISLSYRQHELVHHCMVSLA